MAWAKLIAGDKAGYRAYIDSVGKLGNTLIDADKQAQNEFELNQAPHLALLKSRLLFDGGYYTQALAAIDAMAENEPADFALLLEQIYRKGRIYDEMGNTNAAIAAYKKTIEQGEDSPIYYAANAALHLGYLYEKEGNIEQAIYFFEKSMDMKNHEYKSGIDQKAKAALERLEK